MKIQDFGLGVPDPLHGTVRVRVVVYEWVEPCDIDYVTTELERARDNRYDVTLDINIPVTPLGPSSED